LIGEVSNKLIAPPALSLQLWQSSLSYVVILSGAKNPRISLLLPWLLTPLSARLIQQQRSRHRSIQALHIAGAGNRHARIAQRNPLLRQPAPFITDHHRAAPCK